MSVQWAHIYNVPITVKHKKQTIQYIVSPRSMSVQWVHIYKAHTVKHYKSQISPERLPSVFIIIYENNLRIQNLICNLPW